MVINWYVVNLSTMACKKVLSFIFLMHFWLKIIQILNNYFRILTENEYLKGLASGYHPAKH